MALTLEQKVIQFAVGKLGQSVRQINSQGQPFGNASCASLPYQALKYARTRLPDVSGGFYVWGDLVSADSFKDARAGYIIQLENVSTEEFQYAHHTAIIAGFVATKKGKKNVGIVVYEQNENESQPTVKKAWIMLGRREPGGHYWIYRPAPR